jgi:hypothetical protein
LSYFYEGYLTQPTTSYLKNLLYKIARVKVPALSPTLRG